VTAVEAPELLDTEHERGLHNVFQPRSCGHCWPNGAPPPPESPQALDRAPVAPPRRERGESFEPLAAAMARWRRSIVVDQPDDPPRDPNVADDGGPVCATCNSHRWLRRELPRDHPEFGRTIECPGCAVWRQQKRLERFWGTVPELYRGLSLETYPTRLPEQRRNLEMVRAWLAAKRGTWLYLYGHAGRGKTGLAIAAARELGLPATYVGVSQMLIRIASTYDREVRERDQVREVELLEALTTIDVLVLDELGAEAPTAWAEQRIYQVIDRRSTDPRLITIITTNLSLPKLGARLGRIDAENGERVVSRLLGRTAPFVVEVEGPDLRLSSLVRTA